MQVVEFIPLSNILLMLMNSIIIVHFKHRSHDYIDSIIALNRLIDISDNIKNT